MAKRNVAEAVESKLNKTKYVRKLTVTLDAMTLGNFKKSFNCRIKEMQLLIISRDSLLHTVKLRRTDVQKRASGFNLRSFTSSPSYPKSGAHLKAQNHAMCQRIKLKLQKLMRMKIYYRRMEQKPTPVKRF